MRVYEDDTFLGESRIGHIAEKGDVKFEIGKAFDVSAKRTQTRFQRLGERTAEVSYEIVVTNAKKETVTLLVDEHLNGDWEIVGESQAGSRTSASTYSFVMKIPKRGEATLSYVARMKW